jgi:hypothetical protein
MEFMPQTGLHREHGGGKSWLLQVSIFSMLHKNVKRLAFDALPPDIVTTADGVDAQLKQQMPRLMPADAVRPTSRK